MGQGVASPRPPEGLPPGSPGQSQTTHRPVPSRAAPGLPRGRAAPDRRDATPVLSAQDRLLGPSPGRRTSRSIEKPGEVARARPRKTQVIASIRNQSKQLSENQRVRRSNLWRSSVGGECLYYRSSGAGFAARCSGCSAKTSSTRCAGITTWWGVASVLTECLSCAWHPSLRRFRPHHDTGCR